MGKMRFDETGKRYGHWTVLGKHPDQRGGSFLYWLCRCDCGIEKAVSGTSLRHGTSKSCGCTAYLERTLPEGEATRTVIFHGYRHGALKRGIDFNLTKEQVFHLFEQNCHYCGAPPHQTRTGSQCSSSYTYTGIDRVDSDLGYTPGNVVPCCAECNRAKKSLGVDQFLEWVSRVYHHSCVIA